MPARPDGISRTTEPAYRGRDRPPGKHSPIKPAESFCPRRIREFDSRGRIQPARVPFSVLLPATSEIRWLVTRRPRRPDSASPSVPILSQSRGQLPPKTTPHRRRSRGSRVGLRALRQRFRRRDTGNRSVDVGTVHWRSSSEGRPVLVPGPHASRRGRGRRGRRLIHRSSNTRLQPHRQQRPVTTVWRASLTTSLKTIIRLGGTYRDRWVACIER